MAHLKFDVAKLERLNDPGRFDALIPDVLFEALAADDVTRLVEIGAGTGLFAAEFARRLPDATVYAVDNEPAMIEWMTENRPEVAAGRIVPVASDEAAVPLPDGWAGAVVMINVHHELAEPDALYAEARRIAAPGARVLVADWAPVDSPKGPPLAVRATAEQIAASLDRAGFEAVREHPGALPYHSLVTGTAG